MADTRQKLKQRATMKRADFARISNIILTNTREVGGGLFEYTGDFSDELVARSVNERHGLDVTTEQVAKVRQQTIGYLVGERGGTGEKIKVLTGQIESLRKALTEERAARTALEARVTAVEALATAPAAPKPTPSSQPSAPWHGQQRSSPPRVNGSHG